MHWIALSAKNHDNAALEKRLWDAADQFRANSGLKSQGYSAPVLGLIFLRFAAQRTQVESPSPLEEEGTTVRGGNYSGDPAKEFSIHGVEKPTKPAASAVCPQRGWRKPIFSAT